MLTRSRSRTMTRDTDDEARAIAWRRWYGRERTRARRGPDLGQPRRCDREVCARHHRERALDGGHPPPPAALPRRRRDRRLARPDDRARRHRGDPRRGLKTRARAHPQAGRGTARLKLRPITGTNARALPRSVRDPDARGAHGDGSRGTGRVDASFRHQPQSWPRGPRQHIRAPVATTSTASPHLAESTVAAAHPPSPPMTDRKQETAHIAPCGPGAKGDTPCTTHDDAQPRSSGARQSRPQLRPERTKSCTWAKAGSTAARCSTDAPTRRGHPELVERSDVHRAVGARRPPRHRDLPRSGGRGLCRRIPRRRALRPGPVHMAGRPCLRGRLAPRHAPRRRRRDQPQAPRRKPRRLEPPMHVAMGRRRARELLARGVRMPDEAVRK